MRAQKTRTSITHRLQAGLLSLGLMGSSPFSFADVHKPMAMHKGNEKVEKIDEVSTLAGPLAVYKLASLTKPWGMESLPDGGLLITEKPGTLRIYSKDGTLSEPIDGVPEVAYLNQGGLLDVAIDPKFARNSIIYLYYVKEAEEQPENPMVPGDPRLGPYIDQQDTTKKGGVVIKGKLRDNKLTKVEEIWRQEPFTIGLGHFGGRLALLPDGTLAISSGARFIYSRITKRVPCLKCCQAMGLGSKDS